MPKNRAKRICKSSRKKAVRKARANRQACHGKIPKGGH